VKIPFFQALEDTKNVLIAGGGGGFDVFSGLPLYFYLKKQNKKVHLANLSFTNLGFCDGERPMPSLVRVLPNTGGSRQYFPEVHLSGWLSDRFGETPVYAIERVGARPVANAYQWLADTLGFDTLVLIDGGTDVLMRGDECGLGTPKEDMASLFAAEALPKSIRKLLVCIGFGIDTFHGVCHAHFLENVAALIEDGGYLGAWSLMREMEEFQLYREAFDYVSARMPGKESIVNTSIISAANGWFGNEHASKRTEGAELFINPLMTLFWAFRLENVARRNLYLERLSQTNSYDELSLAIEAFRASLPKNRGWKDIPC
jgi:hypothetical protein